MRCSRTQSSRASWKLPIGWDLFPASLFCLARHGRVDLCKSFPVRSYPGGRPKRFHPAAHTIEGDLVADVCPSFASKIRQVQVLLAQLVVSAGRTE